jgi:hypothetical protein
MVPAAVAVGCVLILSSLSFLGCHSQPFMICTRAAAVRRSRDGSSTGPCSVRKGGRPCLTLETAMRSSARGFNVYDGSLRHSSFESITTHGDGSVGVQVSKALPVLETSGGPDR